jgi:hypothetical protein
MPLAMRKRRPSVSLLSRRSDAVASSQRFRYHEPPGASLVMGAAQRLLLSLGQRLKQKPQRRGRWAGLAESQSASSGWESLRPR